ncbi:efflux RND transporter periplasmic adaptor subunit [Maribacter sp.]|uniref:efflux RND transporter periplasmic adaptor subunit n=1 Tax=Maribacter sp. TaxID=1897614 RepID=UPI0025C54CC9|nr:efflux RND transporter periplasmic adaptor subunit [Maribacter sp.]
MKLYTYSLYSLLLIFTLSGCGNSEKNTTSKTSEKSSSIENEEHRDKILEITKEQFNNAKMEIGKLTKQPFPETITTSGMIDVPPENKAVVSATMGGYIKSTPLLVGDQVTKGQSLVTIENPEFITLQQEYLEIKEQLTYLKSEYDRHKILFAENITSQKNYLKTESEYKTAKAKYNGFRKQLSMLNISSSNVDKGIITTVASVYAPISGSVTKMNVTKGTYVSAAAAILEIINNEHLHVELTVYEKDILKIKKGQEILFKIPEASKEVFKAKVHLIGKSINANRTITVHGHMEDESENNFLTGMFLDANIITSTTKEMGLPEDSIIEQDGKYFVLRLMPQTDSYHFKMIEVNKGDTSNGYTAIKPNKNLTEDSQFLTKGAFNLISEEGGGHSH